MTCAELRVLIKGLIATYCTLNLPIYGINRNICYADDDPAYKGPSTVPWDHEWDNKTDDSIKYYESIPVTYTGKYVKRIKCPPIEPAKVTRNIFLIRYGHAFEAQKGEKDEQRQLSPLGLEQVELVSQKLLDYKHKYDAITYTNNTRRSIETYEGIMDCFTLDVKSYINDLLRRSYPIYPIPTDSDWLPSETSDLNVDKDGERLDYAFHYFFHRPNERIKKSTYEIIVASSNVIRYFVCRALQFPSEAYLRFSLHNCSITWIMINADGRVKLMSLGDSGHIPYDKLTL